MPGERERKLISEFAQAAYLCLYGLWHSGFQDLGFKDIECARYAVQEIGFGKFALALNRRHRTLPRVASELWATVPIRVVMDPSRLLMLAADGNLGEAPDECLQVIQARSNKHGA